MASTYTKKFKEFIQEWNPEDDDYIVGYRSLDDSEIRIPLLAVDNSITSNKYIRKDIDDYANGLLRFNKGFTVSSNIMSTIYLQGLDGWIGNQKGDFEMNSLTLREFLEVPELRKNKITVMGNQFWFTDSAMIKESVATGSGNYDIYFKLEDEEYSSFELNDILKGIYHYSNGFWTVYLKVYELILNPNTLGEIGIRVHSMNGRDPRQSMLLARITNSDDKERQGSLFADGLRKYIRVLDGYDPNDPTSEGSIKTLKVQIGDLSTVTNHPVFGNLEGYGLYADNVYLQGKLIVKNDPNKPGQELGVYRGQWDSKTNYYKYDQVTYNGSLYTSKQIDNTGHIPTGTPDDLWWELTVSKGDSGTSAESNITIELTNDNHSIPTDSDGKNPSYGGAYCTAYVYQGTEDATDVYTITATLESPTDPTKLQFVQNENTVTITYIADDIDNATIKFTAVAEGYPTVSRVWGVAKVKSGKPGEDSTAYWLVTDTPVIKKHIYNISDSEVIRYEPSPFVIRAFSQTGIQSIKQYDGYIRLTYGSQNQVIAGSTYQFMPVADVASYTIELFQDVGLKTLLDKEIVTVVADGTIPNWQTYIFKSSPTIPSTPTYNKPPTTFPTPEGWRDYPNDSTSVWWMSTTSVNGITNVAYNWSKPVKVTGEDGKDGVWTDFKFAKSTSANLSPSIVVTDRNPVGWVDATPSLDDNEYLWMTNAVINPDNTLKTNWSNPVRINGEKGEDGTDGKPGERGPQGLVGPNGLQGPSIAFAGNWSANTQYYGYANTQTCVYYGGKYYYTKTVSPDLSPLIIPSGAANNPASTNGKIYWNEFVGQFDNIATGLLLAERIATAELTTNKMFIVDRQESSGNIIDKNGSIITKDEEKTLNPNQIIGRLSSGWYLDQGVIRSIAVTSDGVTPKLRLDKDGKITATGVNITGTVHFENGTIGSMQVFNDANWTSTVNGPFPASSGFYYLRKNNGVTVTPQGDIIGKDYFLTGDSTKGPSVFIGDVYVPGSSVPGTDDNTLTSFLKLFNSLFERVLIGSQYTIKAKLPLFSIGEITAYGSDGDEPQSLWDGIPVDNITIAMRDGKLTVIGGIGGIKGIVMPAMTAEDALVGATINGVGDTITFSKGTFATKAYVTWGNVTSKPSWIGATKPTYSYSEITGAPPAVDLSNYVTLNTTQTIINTKIFTASPNIRGGGSLTITPRGSGSNANGIHLTAQDYVTFISGIGSYANSGVFEWMYMGWGAEPWQKTTSFSVSSTSLWYKNNELLHAANYNNYAPTKTGGGASGAWNILSSRTNGLEVNYTGIIDSNYGTYGGIIQGNGINMGMPDGRWYNKIKILHGNSAGYYTELAQNFTGSNNLYYRKMENGTLGGWTTVVDSGNYTQILDGRYVNKTGDTMTGMLSINTNTGGYIDFARNGVNVGYIGQGSASNSAIYLSNYASNKGIALLNSGEITYGGVPMWYAGNDGAGSGLDADLLDGAHKDNFLRYGGLRSHGVITTEYTVGTFMTNFAGAGLYLDRGSWDYANNGFINTPYGKIHLAGTMSLFTGSGSAASKYCTYLAITPSTGSLPGGSETNDMLFYTSNGDNTSYPDAWTRVMTDRIIGYYNAGSATKLQTARSIFGQPFDGTSNIAGRGIFYGVGVGYAQGALEIRENNLGNPGAGTLAEAPSIGFHWGGRIGASIKMTNQGLFFFANQNGDGATTVEAKGFKTNNICIETTNGGIYGNTSEINTVAGHLHLQHHNGGSVGIGGVSPLYKLDVNGDIYARGFLYSLKNALEITIGSQNNAYCHYSTTAPIHWFNKPMEIQGTLKPYGGPYALGSSGAPWGAITSSGRSVLAGVSVGGYTNTSYALSVSGIVTNDWFRTVGNTGWYSETYGGGIYMTDGAYVKVFNNKAFLVSNTAYYAINNTGGYYSTWTGATGSDSSWASLLNYQNSMFNANDRSTPINGLTRMIGWSDTVGSQGYMSRYCISSYRTSSVWGSMMLSVGNNDAGTSGYYLQLNGNGQMYWTGSIVAASEITAYSDIRLKSNITNLSFRGRLSPKTYIKDDKKSIGFIAQEVQQLYPELIHIGSDENHYLSLNYGSITAVLSAQINLIDDEVSILKREIKELKQEITNLKNK